jgi:tripartite-type tricarboxylate transporter receptor subunit TctC
MKLKRFIALAKATTVVLCSLHGSGAWSQSLSDARPITWTAAMAAGGPTDSAAREMAQMLSERLGRTITVDPIGGAGGLLAAQKVMNGPKDGTNFLFSTNSLLVNQVLRKKPEYDMARDFVGVSPLIEGPFGIFVNSAVPAGTLKELIDYAKANPGKLNYGSSGIGGIMHLITEDLKARAGIDMEHIPFKGGAQLITELVGNRVQLEILDPNFAKPHVDAGRLRALVVTSRERIVTLPNVPTTAESGLPGYTPTFWMGLYAPAGMPRAIIDQVNGELRAILTNPEVKKRYAARGFTTEWMTPDATQRRIAVELAQLNKVVDDAKIERQ